MGSGSTESAVAALRAAHDELATLPVEALARPELLGVLDEIETLTCQLPVSYTHLTLPTILRV